MAILSVSDISCSFGERTLFSGGSFTVEKQDKIGFIGGNGVGKTTLFKVLAGLMEPSGGQVSKANECRIGYLEQHALSDSDQTLKQAVASVFEPIYKMESELEAISEALIRGEGDTEKLIARQHSTEEAYRAAGGLTYKSRLSATLFGIGFTAADLEKPVRVLSGGERTMASLARLLLSDVTLLLLDEPTNHLDMDACVWLEDYLRRFEGAAILISHDRYFLDRVTNKTMRLSGGKFTVYTGGYTEFTKKRQAEEEYAARLLEKQNREIKRIEGIIETQRRFNRERNIRMAESKQKQIDRLRMEMEAPILKEKGVHLAFSPARESGGDVLFAEGLSKNFGEKNIFQDIDIRIFKHDRVFLLGPNGCGKTTLLSVLRGAMAQNAGTVRLGTKVDIGYFDQKHADLALHKTALEEVRDAFPQETETALRSALAAMGLRGDAVHALISTLSGGERAKVALVKLLFARPNFLLLDEPTNHLDIDAKEALEEALLDYGGTMLVISHDRYFVDKLATRVLAMDKGTLTQYDGGFHDYMEKRKADTSQVVSKETKKPTSYQEEKEMRAKKRRAAAALERVEKEIGEVEAEIDEKNRELEGAGADYEKAMELTKQITELESKRCMLYEKWETLV